MKTTTVIDRPLYRLHPIVILALGLLLLTTRAQATLTLSKATSTNDIANAFYLAYLNNVIPIQPNSIDTAVGRNFIPKDPGTEYSGWQITSLSLQAQSSFQTVDGGAVWTVTIFEWEPSTNLFDMRYWTNGTDANPLAGFPSVKIILQDSGSLGTNMGFAGHQFLNFKFDTNSYYFLKKEKSYGVYFSRANATNTFTAQAAYGSPVAASFQKQVGTTGSVISFLDLGLLIGGVAVPITKPQLSSPQFVTAPETRFQLSLTGDGSTTYRVEYTTNFLTWDTLTNAVGPTNGLSIVDPDLSGISHRFYRAVKDP